MAALPYEEYVKNNLLATHLLVKLKDSLDCRTGFMVFDASDKDSQLVVSAAADVIGRELMPQQNIDIVKRHVSINVPRDYLLSGNFSDHVPELIGDFYVEISRQSNLVSRDDINTVFVLWNLGIQEYYLPEYDACRMTISFHSAVFLVNYE